jgi:hypothetical protein
MSKKKDKAAKHKPIARVTLIEAIDELGKAIRHENALPCVLISVSYVEQQLATLLSAFLIADPVSEALFNPLQDDVLSTYSSRTKMAYCLGLIGKELFENLKRLGHIRNRFAHSHLSIGFDDKEVADLCMALAFPQLEGDDDAATQYIAWALYDDGPRHRFTSIIMLVAFDLMHAIEKVNAEGRRSKQPDRWAEPPGTVPYTTLENYIRKGFRVDDGTDSE